MKYFSLFDYDQISTLLIGQLRHFSEPEKLPTCRRNHDCRNRHFIIFSHDFLFIILFKL